MSATIHHLRPLRIVSPADCEPRPSKEVYYEGKLLGHATSWSEAKLIAGMHGIMLPRIEDCLSFGVESPEAFIIQPERLR